MKQLSDVWYRNVRKRLAESMPEDSVLLLAGNGELERTRDVAYPFRQSNNFLYLSGISQPDAYLIVRKAQSGAITEQLCIKQLHPFMAAWEGRSNHITELQEISGIQDVREYKKTEELLTDLPQIVYIDMPDEKNAQIAAWQLWQQIQEVNPDLELASINPELDTLRVVKTDEEVDQIRAAIAETDRILRHVHPLLVPGVTERSIAAEFVRAAGEHGIEQAWPPIVSFGKNSVVIHHTPDETKLADGDLVLFDVGVEINGYTSDVSRMVQIGKMSERQLSILRAVQDVQSEAINLMKPGIKFDEFERQSAEIMVHKLIELGLFASVDEAMELEGELQWPAYRRYFNHMTSHYLGLDGHDVGPRDAEFVPGMVLTCEPGIYIAEEGIGVRIEDDILITKDGNQNLSAGVVLDS
jgi:Xaa-Pro aminopeptidase